MTGQQQEQRAEDAPTAAADPASVNPAVATQVLGPTDAEWDARIEAILQQIRTDPTRGLQQAQEALGELRGQQRLDLESRLVWLVGHSHLRDNRMVDAAVALHRAVGLAQTTRRVDLEADYLATLGVVQGNMGAFSEAIESFERALGLHRGLPPSCANGLLPAKILGNFGTTFVLMGLPHKALPLYQEARDRFLQLGLVRDVAASLSACAYAQIKLAEREARSTSAPLSSAALAAAREACAIAEQVLADPSMEAEDEVTINARLTVVRAHTILGDSAAAIEELNQIDPHLTSDAHRSWFRADRSTLRARLLRLTGRTSEAIAELQAEPLDDLTPFDRTGILEELIATQEAAADLAGALASFRRYHELTLQARDQSAEQRGQVLHARLELERAQHKAEIERLRAEQLTLRNEELARQAHMDALTGLPNRRGLDAALAHRIGEERAQFACVLADIDHFKRINDRYSHLVGDEVLRRVGALMREVVRDGDVAARYGGEEFALLLDRVDGRQAVEVCERLRQVIAAQPWEQIVGGLAVTISLGVVMRRAGDSGEALLGRADGCLYAAKAAGRDRVVAEAAGADSPLRPE
jgi:diguanylate cyclase (GGDEF)-like protein